jgi:hypothetical protein
VRRVRRIGLLFSGLAVLGLVGCAPTASRPYHQSVTVGTEPAGAACLVTGGAEPIAEVASTPAVVALPQSGRDVRVFCTLAGREPAATVLPAELEVAKLALVTALVGPATVAGFMMAGGGRRYAPSLTVALPAMRFATAEERDHFFAARADESRRHFDQPIRAHKSMCRPDEFGCQHMISEMERARDAELARLEELRKATPAPE